MSELNELSKITIASILGCLIRILLNQLYDYNPSPTFSPIYSQIIGCFIMGAVQTRKQTHYYTAISSGLCGSITTFSGFNSQLFYYLFSIKQENNWGYNILSAISVFIITLGMGASAIQLGNNLALEYKPKGSAERSNVNIINHLKTNLFISLILWIVPVFTLLFMEAYKNISFALILAPLGAIMRYKLSGLKKDQKYPYGTLTSNLIGSILYAALLIPNSISIVDQSRWGEIIVYGALNGFCGCLTTISSFVLEILNMETRSALKYCLGSVALAQLFFVLIPGLYYWLGYTLIA